MINTTLLFRVSIVAGALSMGAGSVAAAGGSWWPMGWKGWKFSSEIIVPVGGATRGTASSASEARKKARASVVEPAPPLPATIIAEPVEEEDGVLSRPSRGMPTDNRARALDYSRGLDPDRPAVIVVPGEPAPGSMESTREGVERNLGRARQYSEGATGSGAKAGTYVKIGTAVGVVGKDGVVVMVCDETNNTAGRIGDDTQSGNMFNVVINGKVAKARCK